MVEIDQEELDAINELKSMSREELDNVMYDLKKWRCQAKGCTNGTTIRDYGSSPFFYHPRKKGQWFDLRSTYWLCGKHNKFMKRLLKSFSKDSVMAKIIDFINVPMTKLIDIPSDKSNKIDWKDDIDK